MPRRPRPRLRPRELRLLDAIRREIADLPDPYTTIYFLDWPIEARTFRLTRHTARRLVAAGVLLIDPPLNARRSPGEAVGLYLP